MHRHGKDEKGTKGGVPILHELFVCLCFLDLYMLIYFRVSFAHVVIYSFSKCLQELQLQLPPLNCKFDD